MKNLKHILNHILLHFELEETERLLVQLPESHRSDVFNKLTEEEKNFLKEKLPELRQYLASIEKSSW